MMNVFIISVLVRFLFSSYEPVRLVRDGRTDGLTIIFTYLAYKHDT